MSGTPERPTTEWINIEFVSSCNLRCKWCSLDHSKPTVIMTPELLARILDEIAGSGDFVLDRIELHNGGETLLHPDLPAMFAEIRARKSRLPEINLLTNASALNESKTRLIVDSGAIDTLRVSIDGGTRASFEELRAPARWTKIRDNVRRFVEYDDEQGHPVRTGVICVVDTSRSLDTSWMEPDFQELFARIDDVSIRYPHNWDGSVDLTVDDTPYREHAAIMQGKVCYFLTKDLVILPSGDVTVCCADLNSRGVLGNVQRSTLREIYDSPQRQAMLQAFRAGRKNDIELCRDCTGYYM